MAYLFILLMTGGAGLIAGRWVREAPLAWLFALGTLLMALLSVFAKKQPEMSYEPVFMLGGIFLLALIAGYVSRAFVNRLGVGTLVR